MLLQRNLELHNLVVSQEVNRVPPLTYMYLESVPSDFNSTLSKESFATVVFAALRYAGWALDDDHKLFPHFFSRIPQTRKIEFPQSTMQADEAGAIVVSSQRLSFPHNECSFLLFKFHQKTYWCSKSYSSLVHPCSLEILQSFQSKCSGLKMFFLKYISIFFFKTSKSFST